MDSDRQRTPRKGSAAVTRPKAAVPTTVDVPTRHWEGTTWPRPPLTRMSGLRRHPHPARSTSRVHTTHAQAEVQGWGGLCLKGKKELNKVSSYVRFVQDSAKWHTQRLRSQHGARVWRCSLTCHVQGTGVSSRGRRPSSRQPVSCARMLHLCTLCLFRECLYAPDFLHSTNHRVLLLWTLCLFRECLCAHDFLHTDNRQRHLA